MKYVALLFGGALGGLGRYFLAILLPPIHAFPIATLFVNLSGSLLLGAFYGEASQRNIPEWLRIGVGTGAIGAFTTFSTFCVGAQALVPLHPLLIYAYVFISIVGGPMLAYLGDVWVASMRSEQVRTAEEA